MTATLAARREGVHEPRSGDVFRDRRANGPAELTEDQMTEVVRLDVLIGGLWARARRGEVAAVDRVLKLAERRTVIILGAAGVVPASSRHDGPRSGAS